MASSSELKNQQNQKIRERDTLIERKSGVDTIAQRIETDFEYVISRVNDMINCTSWYYQSGLVGRKASIASDIESEIEGYEYSDPKLSSCKGNLQSESTRCQNRIDVLNEEISSLNSQIAQAEYEEEQARKRALEEYLASLNGGNDNESGDN